MATKRLTIKLFDWAKLAERVPANDKAMYLAFKGKSDGYLRRMLSNPENPPKLDWEMYKKLIPVPGMVDAFQKQYESLQIPYPQDTASSQIDAQEQELKKAVEEFKSGSEQRIQKFREEISYMNSLIPYEQMSMEEFLEVNPGQLDLENNPTFWPHDPDEIKEIEEAEKEMQESSH
ncbi:ATP synthase subunit d, mitochondrial [Cimex lectularius]|uniref:ATP synthase subunit d, mitochondrial n=1 Tax=Cimex lectularius TaxID=79782 RepID=A0A8I6RGJ6_CIMLE|nr:ATP synthase subunit d, mitochondrial [Cimex lectularius]